MSNLTTPQGLTPNTYVSITLVVVIVGATIWIRDSITKTVTKMDTSTTAITTELSRGTEKVEGLIKRVEKLEGSKETWTYQDMFKWSVRLQRDNATLKVPEPEARDR